MYRYVRKKTGVPPCGVLNVYHNEELFVPVIYHATFAQNRPVGDIQTFQVHRHDLYHIVLYTEGQGVCLMNCRDYVTQRGTLIFVSPGQPHNFTTHFGSSVYSELTFSFENKNKKSLTLPIQKVLEQWIGEPICLENPIQLSESQTHLLNTHITEVIDLAAIEHPFSEFHLQFALLKILHFVVLSCSRPEVTGAIADERLIRVRQHIEEHYNTLITIEDILQLAGFSRAYLYRAFRKAFGITPLNYQKQLRLEAARTLLRSSALRCTEIAARCGYENVHYFHRQFKKAFAVTPLRYRKDKDISLP